MQYRSPRASSALFFLKQAFGCGMPHSVCITLPALSVGWKKASDIVVAQDALAGSSAEDLASSGRFTKAEIERALDYLPLRPAGDGRVLIQARERH